MKYSLIEGLSFTVGGSTGTAVAGASYTTYRSASTGGTARNLDASVSAWPGTTIGTSFPDFYSTTANDLYTGKAAQINSNYDSIATNYGTHTTLYNADKSDTIDDYGNLIYKYDNNNPSPNTRDVLLQDNNDILVQQNMTYIIGMIAASTLIISAIMISRK